MIWELETLAQVEGLRVETFVDASYPWDVVVPRMRRAVIGLAHPLGVDVDEQDVTFEAKPKPETAQHHVRARWAPATTEIELRGGGQLDGMRLNFTRVGELIRVPVPGSGGTSLPFHRAGWREDDRVWLYDRTT